MKILSIDPGSWKTGVALYNTETKKLKVELLKINRRKNTLDYVYRANKMSGKIKEIIKKTKPDKIIIERPHLHLSKFGTTKSFVPLIVTVSFIINISRSLCEDIIEIAPEKWTNRIKKQDRIKSLSQKFVSEDIADAYCMISYYVNGKYEDEVVIKGKIGTILT